MAKPTNRASAWTRRVWGTEEVQSYRRHRSTISFLPDEFDELIRVAGFFGVSYAEVLREAVRMYAINIAGGGD